MKTPETIEKSMVKSILGGIPFRDWWDKNGKNQKKSKNTCSKDYSLLKAKNLDNISEIKKEVVEATKEAQKEMFKVTLEHKAMIEQNIFKMAISGETELSQLKASELLAKLNGWNAPTLKAIDFIDNTPKEKEQKHIIFIKK